MPTNANVQATMKRIVGSDRGTPISSEAMRWASGKATRQDLLPLWSLLERQPMKRFPIDELRATCEKIGQCITCNPTSS
jgi:hypothetical protein